MQNMVVDMNGKKRADGLAKIQYMQTNVVEPSVGESNTSNEGHIS